MERNEAAALLFIASSTNAMDVYSAVNSSPWTGYNFANDDRAREALRYYVAHAIVITALTNVGGALLAQSWWPIFGATITAAYMYWLYEDAIRKGKEENSEGWDKQASDMAQPEQFSEYGQVAA
jgi:hypothetical protein